MHRKVPAWFGGELRGKGPLSRHLAAQLTLYTKSRLGRPTVPARVLATVMVLQAHEGLSDQEAADRLERDLAWQAAAGVHSGYEAFHPTVLVGMRNRLRASKRPRRLFEDTKKAAAEAGVMGDRARVLDSTPLYDAVATQDTVTQLRSAVRKLLRLLEGTELETKVRVRVAARRRLRWPGQAAVRLGRPRCPRRAGRRPGGRRQGLLAVLEGEAAETGRGRGRRAVGARGRPGHRTKTRRHVPHRQESGQGPDHFDRRPRGPSRPQVPRPPFRRVQSSRLVSTLTPS